MTLECEIDHKHHRGILGAKGANVQAITSEHKVSIKFPDRVSDSNPATVNGEDASASKNMIYVTGRKENAEAAIRAMRVRVIEIGMNFGCGTYFVVI